MKFRTELKITKNPGFFNQSHRVLTIGSCFAVHIYERLKKSGFQVENNPFGILFNPHSICKNGKNAYNQTINEEMIVERDERVVHYDFHSSIHAETPAELKSKIHQIQTDFKNSLLTVDRLIITFGTAWVYRNLNTNEIVANCHKVPQVNFSKELLDLDQLIAEYSDWFDHLRTINPKLEILLTVSPVRHIKDGLRENNLSKSILLLLTAALENKFECVSYFPAYELIVDDLRDYRFYKTDLIHPTEQAADYVFEQFKSTYFDENTNKIGELYSKISQIENHKPLHPSQKGDEQRSRKINELEEEIKRKLQD